MARQRHHLDGRIGLTMCHSLELIVVASSGLSLVAGQPFAQAPPNLASARVRYNSLKNSAKPDGELKAQIDADRQGDCRSDPAGQISQVRRLIAKGTALLQGRGWTDADDYDQSLVLRTDRVVRRFVRCLTPCDSSRLYAPSIAVDQRADARARSVRWPLAARSRPGAAARRSRASAQGVHRRQPRSARQPAGDGARSVVGVPTAHTRSTSKCSTARERWAPPPAYRSAEGTRRAAASARKHGGRGDRVRPRRHSLPRRRRAARQSRRDGVRAVRPRARAHRRRIDRRSSERRQRSVRRANRRFRAALPARRGGRDHAVSRLCARRATTRSKPAPLVVALHGLGGDEDGWMDRYSGTLPELAEKYGYIAVSPLGYRVRRLLRLRLPAATRASRRKRRSASRT